MLIGLVVFFIFVCSFFVVFTVVSFQKFKKAILQLQKDNQNLLDFISTSSFLIEELSKISVELQKNDLETAKTIKNVADYSTQVGKTFEEFQSSVYDAIRVLVDQFKANSLVKTTSKASSLTSLPNGKKNDKIKPD